MVAIRAGCRTSNKAGEPCGFNPPRDKDVCFWHDPEHAEEAAEARRRGGLRRRREAVIQGSYDLNGLATVIDLRRVLEIAFADAVVLDNSIPRVRSLVNIVQVGAKLLETGELEERLRALEAAVGPRLKVAGRRSR